MAHLRFFSVLLYNTSLGNLKKRRRYMNQIEYKTYLSMLTTNISINTRTVKSNVDIILESSKDVNSRINK
jgi:hypothetical protein